jgi:hypothetical protein
VVREIQRDKLGFDYFDQLAVDLEKLALREGPAKLVRVECLRPSWAHVLKSSRLFADGETCRRKGQEEERGTLAFPHDREALPPKKKRLLRKRSLRLRYKKISCSVPFHLT